jgi:hypothetical protein
MSRITFEVPQSKHPFVGLGPGIIITENGDQEPRIIVKFPLYGIEIVTALGDEAKKVMLNMSSDEVFNEDRIEYAKNIACEVLEISMFELLTSQKKSGEQKASFGRWLVWDYAKNNLNLSLSECGDIFNKSHSTVLWGVNRVSTEKGWRKIAYLRFTEKMKIYSSYHEEEPVS